MARAAEKNKDVRYDPQLIDATYALLLSTYGEPLVIPTLNRDGDCMSDMVLQMFGSIAGAESLPLRRVALALGEPPGHATPQPGRDFHARLGFPNFRPIPGAESLLIALDEDE